MSEKVNMQDLMDCLVEKQGVSKKEAENFVKEFFRLIEEALERDKYVKIKGFGTFKLISVDSRESININTGERFEIHGHTKISFIPDSSLREYINKPFAHFETIVLHENTVFADDMQINPQDFTGVPDSIEQDLDKSNKKMMKNVEMHFDDNSFEQEKQEEEIKQQSADLGKTVCTSSVKSYSLMVILLLLLLGVCIVYFCINLKADYYKSGVAQKEINERYDLNNEVVLDTIENSIKDTIEKIVETPINVSKTSSSKYIAPDSTTYLIVGTDTVHVIQEGETLVKVALKYYGTKALWPYLAIHNSTIISNPNHVPWGTKIKIPKLEKK